MKKIIPVSIGGQPFSLEDDAYYRLERYLNDLKNYFSEEPESSEIVTDIELRIAEHLRGRAPLTEKVVAHSDIEWVIGIMGEPSEYGDRKRVKANSNVPFLQRRMYRDPDNRILGGVCAGMAAYWKQDVLLFRVLFIIAAIWGGIGIVVYLVLLIVIPEANTTAEKLEMRGDPVTAETIGRSHNQSKNRP